MFHFRQAIVTRYHGPTNTRGSRVTATAQAGRATVGWDHALNSDQNHAAAARALASKWGWSGELHGGALPDGRGYAFVFTTDGSKVQG
jgi:hypothetical protein